MNRERRMVLHSVLDGLARLRDPIDKEEALKILKETQHNVEQCMDDEQDALDNRPESFKWSAGTTDMEDNISDLSDANADLEIALDVCEQQSVFDYEGVRSDVTNAVRTINQVISR